MSRVRLTPEMVDNEIAQVAYHRFPGTTTTVCCITLRNGHNIVGKSNSLYLEDFVAETGMECALEDAKAQIWDKLAFRVHEGTKI